MKSNKAQQPFVAVNDKERLIREMSFNPVTYPHGRSWMRISKFLMGRTTKIGKTQINMSIATGDKIFVGNKTSSVHVSLSNPTVDQLASCELNEDLKIADEIDRKKLLESFEK
jgi:hypothetical protein